MATATESSLDAQVNKALGTLKRRRALKEAAALIVLALIGALLLWLTAVMYQEPVGGTTPVGEQQPSGATP